MECGDFIESPSEQQVGKAWSSVCVERAPVFRRANDILSAHTGQPFARTIPNQYLRIGADNVCRNDQVLHEAHGEAVVIDHDHRSKRLPIVISGHGNDEKQKSVKPVLMQIGVANAGNQ
jgi:hypothetical protein